MSSEVGDVADEVAAVLVPLPERAFYEQEFAGGTIVVSLDAPDRATVEELCRAATSLARADARLVLVVGAADPAVPAEVAAVLGSVVGRTPTVLAGPGGDPAAPPGVDWLAHLWLAVHTGPSVLISVEPGSQATVAAGLAAALGALKLVITDPAGGWGEPPRSFADVTDPDEGYRAELADRQDGTVVPAIERALAGGVVNANLCRARDLDRELFTFDGTGTLFTHGGYLRIEPLRVDDLPAVQALVDQGVADGLLRPRSPLELARLAVTGLGARVVGGDHLAGLVGLDRAPYEAEGMAEVACLYAVSRFSAAGAGGLLVDGLVEQARVEGLRAVFAVTVSDAAAAFFSRMGFEEVGHDAVPAAKWADYDPARRAIARVFLRSLG